MVSNGEKDMYIILPPFQKVAYCRKKIVCKKMFFYISNTFFCQLLMKNCELLRTLILFSEILLV